MSQPRHRDPLTQALARLSRQPTSANFTGEVLTELETRDWRHARPAPRLLWATAATLILASLLALGYGYQQQRAAEKAYKVQVEELRSRYQELLDGVATVRQEVATPDTRLYLGGDERLDLILDLGQTPTYQDSWQDRTDVRPATFKQ